MIHRGMSQRFNPEAAYYITCQKYALKTDYKSKKRSTIQCRFQSYIFLLIFRIIRRLKEEDRNFVCVYIHFWTNRDGKNIYIGRNSAGQNHQNFCPVKLLCISRLVSGLSSCPLNSPDWHYSNRPEASDFPQWEQIHRSHILIWCSDWFRYPSGLSAG